MITRDTLTFRRKLTSPPDRVFKALIDPTARRAWGTPGEGFTLRIEGDAQPSAGARELSYVVSQEEGETEIVTDWILLQAEERVVYSEMLVHGGITLGISFADAGLTATDQGCDLDLVVHVTGYMGPEIISEMQAGWDHAMAAFTLYIDKAAAA
jgi:uncharacterized protein YndB with AHSA1/START domain